MGVCGLDLWLKKKLSGAMYVSNYSIACDIVRRSRDDTPAVAAGKSIRQHLNMPKKCVTYISVSPAAGWRYDAGRCSKARDVPAFWHDVARWLCCHRLPVAWRSASRHYLASWRCAMYIAYQPAARCR